MSVLNGSMKAAPSRWMQNVDPYVDAFPFVNEDLWMLAAFLTINLVVSRVLGYPKRNSSQTVRPYAFTYYCFMCGLCAGCFAICSVISNMGENMLTCRPLLTFSHLGFRGRIKAYIVYMSFLTKLVHVVEAIWSKSTISWMLFSAELVLCISGLKYDGTDYIWMAGALNLPFILTTSYLNAYAVSGNTDRKPSEIAYARKTIINMLVVIQTIFLVVHSSYTLAVPNCAYPKHWSVMGFIFAYIGWTLYPRVYITDYV